ncbi:MAG: dihydroorotate dehydrogenase electron transfer subunit [Clostridia bacterium]|nr:dihydroorotate dehydrogenase electron transfer subunit [Clostridia bacterium]
MKQGLFTIVSNELLAPSVYRMVLEGDTSGFTTPGQFADISIPGLYLRRPISLCDMDDKTMTFIYKVVGTGTDAMSNMTAGQQLDVLTGLGNGYDLSRSGDKPVLIGGGVGVPPMYYLAKQLIKAGKEVTVILGFNNASEIFYAKEFEEIGAKVYVTTVDGSVGTKGFVIDVLKTLDYSFFYTCGPMPMFRAIEAVATTDGQYSFEQRMGCGFGACMGCSMETKNGPKRVCKEGPVMDREEIIW